MKPSSVLRALFCFLLLAELTTARADLVLTNYSFTKMLKIIPIGDSITDDCEVNGAWRLYLQPLLLTNGYNWFLFTGRQASSAVYPNFTKVYHEGYCGAVIAPPGVYAAHQYSTTANYLQKIVPDAMTVVNNRPTLVLLLIGANDIGRGRDPHYVATNDMANLLDLTFTNVPNAYIILAKITSLQNANISGLNYADYATNVPIYNATLQALVNSRRALGQNVFLADMFSVVNSNMFMADNVHPNAAGLNAIATEWLARIQAITQRTNLVTSTLIMGGDTWKYSDAGQDLGTNWAQSNYDDSGWSSGIARLGYGDPTTATTVSYGPDPANKFVTTYFRHWFVTPANAVITNLNFRLARADGVAVWLNGQEIFRTNLPSGPLSYTNQALSAMTGYTAQIFYPTNVAVTGLPPGTNLVAVEMHLSSVTNASLGFDMELIGTGYPVPQPPIAIAQTGGNILLSWPATNVVGFTLYSTTNLAAAGNWILATAPTQTNGGQITVTLSPDSSTKFFRLQWP